MGIRKYTNFTATTLDGTITAIATSIIVTSAADFPSITAPETFSLVLTDGVNPKEIVKVTAVSGQILTVVRAQEGTLGFAWQDDDDVELRHTADGFERLAENAIVYPGLNSGLFSGGALSIGTDTAKFDMAAGNGIIVDAYTDPNNPVVTEVEWSAFDEVTVTLIATTNTTEIAIDTTGAIVQLADGFTETDFRDYILVGTLVHPSTVIIDVNNTPVLGIQTSPTLIDLCMSVGLITVSGNIYSENGANLNIDKTVGGTFGGGLNWTNSQKIPNNTTDGSDTLISFFPSHQDGSGGVTILSPTTTIDTNFYDDGSGTLAALANNKFMVHRIDFYPANGNTQVEYAQDFYDSLDAAELAIPTQAFVTDDTVAVLSTLRAFLIVKKGTTDLSNAAEAKFIVGTKSRLTAGAAGGGSGGGADQALSNLASVAVNTSLISDTDSTDDLGSTGIRWANLWVDDIVTTTDITLGGDLNITSGFVDMTEAATPGNPAANVGRIYVADLASVTTLYFRDNAGVETNLLSAGGGDPDQNLWETITSDSGSAVANTTTDTITFSGGTAISTAVSGDTLTITAIVATTGAQGVAELATTVETAAGTDTGRVIPVSALPSQIQDSKYVYAADAEASDTYVITLVPAPAAYAAGQVFHFDANTVNTGAATLNVNGLGAKAILKNHDVVLADGDIEAGQLVSVIYDGTQFQMLSQLGNADAGGDMVLASVQTVTGAKTFGGVGDVGKLIVAGTTSGTTSIDATAVAGSTTVSLPAATDTLMGKATTDTMTNKTFDANGTGNSISNIDVADLANGTDGEIITWDSSGVATTVGAGTVGQVFTSAGAGAEPTFQSGGTTIISDQTASSSASLDVTGIDGSLYSHIEIQFEGIVPATDDAAFLLRIGNSGSGFFATGYINMVRARHGGGGNDATLTTGFTLSLDEALDGLSDAVGDHYSGTAIVFNLNTTVASTVPNFTVLSTYTNAQAEKGVIYGGGELTQTAAMDRVQCLMDTGNIAQGRMIVIGHKI